jgi:hypothetical protein
MQTRVILICLFLVCIFSSCGDESTKPEVVIFEICPVDTATISEASPLGNMNPPGHTFPSNHIGFYLKGMDLIPVSAMTAGTIRTVYYNEWSDDFRIEIDHTESILSYFDHICNLAPDIIAGAKMQTGELVGYARRSNGAFDIGVINYDVVNSFITPERYHEFYLYYDDPYTYFTDSIRQILELKNPRIGEPKGGKIDFDQDGTLAGNWFIEGTPLTYEASSYLYGENQLAFVYDMYNASTILVSCGGTLEEAPFSFRVVGNNPNPALVSPASGLVKYQLDSPFNKLTMLVQMIDNRTIQAEIFAEKLPSEVSSFTSHSKIYIR